MFRRTFFAVSVAIVFYCQYACSSDCLVGTRDYFQPERFADESEYPAGDNLERWMANYLAINDFECRYRRYSVEQPPERRAELLKGNPSKDARGYYLLSDHFIKFRPGDRLYFRQGLDQTAGDGGGMRELLIAHDGSDHRTFVEEVYSGLIKPEANPSINIIQHPNHLLSANTDLEQLHKAGSIIQEDALVFTTRARHYGIVTPDEIRPPQFDQIRFHLSPEHGFMPKTIEVIREVDSARLLYEIDSFEKLDGIWFPVRARITFTPLGGKPRSTNLLEVDIASLKLNQGLKPADYRFEFPAGSGYMNVSTGEKVIGDEFLRRDKLVVAAAQREFENPKSNLWIWFAGVTVGVVLVLWGLYRRLVGARIHL